MISASVILFSIAAAVLVWLAGRRDAARDPLLTVVALGLLAAFPLLTLLPKVPVAGLPSAEFTWSSGPWLLWIWAGGVAVCSLRLIGAMVTLAKWRRRSRDVADINFQNNMPPIRVMDDLPCPVAIGIFRPLILVPKDWDRWSLDMKHTVVDHEATHHRRRDPLWRAVATIACTLHWYNPLCWWMAARLANQCEFACDAAVLKNGRPMRVYVQSLCDIAARHQAPQMALPMAAQQGLEARVRRMVSPPPRASRAWIILLAGMALFSATVLAIVDRTPAEILPVIDQEEVRTRLMASPFPSDQ